MGATYFKNHLYFLTNDLGLLYDKRAANFLGAIYLAASVIWLN
jgi:hypothetical protein